MSGPRRVITCPGPRRPRNGMAVGPVISTWPSSSRHSISSVPPSSTRSTLRSASPRRMAATAVAQAPVPQASVMPTPRSQTRMRMRPGSSTWANSTLVRVGKEGQGFDPGTERGDRRLFSVRHEQHAMGIAHRDRADRNARAANVQREIRLCRLALASGTCCQSSRGSPMSTVTRPLPASLQASIPPLVDS